MDDELTPEQKFAAEDAETMVPRALRCGRHPDDIVADRNPIREDDPQESIAVDDEVPGSRGAALAAALAADQAGRVTSAWYGLGRAAT